ncbi:reverse transcriptase [Plasmopara halstedii]|uniref:Reverse transcriptase n=1 Tax=Plasmopara halstedii TaxID=4781 RepID=A0A0P1A425_PLAHL|nr:reverse transcriptase [Plasmopara halstedii]CEG35247.1 reverse transcriptase [Plasmopara halstedii]|eukprot:XP_024571616.1 reverse transcriptase [Plasmopara halstedii]
MKQSWKTLRGAERSNWFVVPEESLDSESFFDIVIPRRRLQGPPSVLPPDRGVRHEIDLVTETENCVTCQRTLSKEQYDVIDAILRASTTQRESKSLIRHPRFVFGSRTESGVSLNDWSVPNSLKQLRQWLGLANYLPKYMRNFAALIQPLTTLLNVEWEWSKDHHDDCPVHMTLMHPNLGLSRAERFSAYKNMAVFAEVKKSWRKPPLLATANHDNTFLVVCDASDYAIGYALMQNDDEGQKRAVSYQSRRYRPAERTYPVYDKELLAMRYAYLTFRVYLLGEERFAIYPDNASLRTAVTTPHLSQRML